jgi:MinD-like ATPase involved in chromosome partitioning or flagellar assembly
MNKLFTLMVLVALVGCAEKKPLTAEEQWKGYCTSVGNAANTIMYDRQNNIDKAAALEHANKIEDATTKTFILDIIEQVYAFPLAEITADPEASRSQFKQKIKEKCIATPHDKMPDYKPF